MSPKSLHRIDDLIKLLHRLTALHEELLGVIRQKIDAMKRSDVDAMREFGEKELLIVNKIMEREGLRRRLMDLIGEDLKLPPRSTAPASWPASAALPSRTLSLKQLIACIPPASQSMLNEGGDRLRNGMTRVAAANRVAGEIARRIVKHLKWVFASVRPSDGGSVGYSHTGVLVPPASWYAGTDTRLLDAMG